MPVVMELLPPWQQTTPKLEKKRLDLIQRFNSLSPMEIRLEAKKRMDWFDSLPRDIREIVHEEGPGIVKAAIKAGNHSAASIQKFIKQFRIKRIAYNSTPAGGLKALF